MEPEDQDKLGNDSILASGIDIDEDEDELEHHEPFKRGTRKVAR